MQQRLYGFLVVLLLMFCGGIFAQGNQQLIPGKLTSLNNSFSDTIKKCRVDSKYQKLFLQQQLFRDSVYKQSPVFYLKSRAILTPSFYSKQLGFFCQKELQLQKITSIPIRFRLGSLDYVNYLEQKPNAIKPY